MAPRAATFNFLRNCALILCLFAPSAWMIATIPPLWRDVDAYNQLTRDPLLTTFWGHAPAYSYIAKVPLFLGEQVERWRGNAVASPESGLSQLTDTGVGLLILLQHLALCGAAFYFICTISQFYWTRLALALAWASNTLFYSFAQCVGSETLSVILVVLVVAKGLRLIRSRGEPRWMGWYLFAIGLCLCLLSRHVNLWLILLLPVAFLLAWAQNRGFLVRADRVMRCRRRLGARHLRQAVIALAIGIACVAVASSLTQRLARKSKFHPHSRIGYTFLWRLQFLKALPPAERTSLLQKVAARARSKEARQLVTLLEQMHDEGTDPLARPFTQRAIPLLFPLQTQVPWERLDVALNQMAFAFLLPPTPEHLNAARADFVAALKMPVTEVSDWLFVTTAYFFDHRDEMSACARLVTFREASAGTINRIPSQHRYFHWWRGLTYSSALVIWSISLLALAVLARRKEVNVAATSAYGIALVAVGLLIAVTNTLLSEFLPRYALPMWQLLLLSLYLFAGTTADLLAKNRLKRIARSSIS
ncbi:MAG TPA: hypothetical protein VNP98_15450 [Chthoniobacterales bacterium]|nr:hypothetical protein [Chthoniobacterales bacterium]